MAFNLWTKKLTAEHDGPGRPRLPTQYAFLKALLNQLLCLLLAVRTAEERWAKTESGVRQPIHPRPH
jgi:hypothetical protein